MNDGAKIMNSREILNEIGKQLALKTEKDGSKYLRIEPTDSVIRFANHKTHLDSWESRYKDVPFPKHMISVVFEDEPTISSTTVSHPRKKQFEVKETTYKLYDGNNLEMFQVHKIMRSLLNFTGEYIDTIYSIKPVSIKSQNPKIFVVCFTFNVSKKQWSKKPQVLDGSFDNIEDAKSTVQKHIKTNQSLYHIRVYSIRSEYGLKNDGSRHRKQLYCIANCSNKIANKLGIRANEFIVSETSESIIPVKDVYYGKRMIRLMPSSKLNESVLYRDSEGNLCTKAYLRDICNEDVPSHLKNSRHQNVEQAKSVHSSGYVPRLLSASFFTEVL